MKKKMKLQMKKMKFDGKRWWTKMKKNEDKMKKKDNENDNENENENGNENENEKNEKIIIFDGLRL